MNGNESRATRLLRRVFQFRSMRPFLETELDAEINDHLERTRAALMRQGYGAEAARCEAERRFGDLRQHRADMQRSDRRRGRRSSWRMTLEAAWDMIRHAVRSLRASPGVTATVVVTIALGVGANATMFGIVDRLLLRAPEHVQDPDHVVRFYVERDFLGNSVTSSSVSYQDYTDWLDLQGLSGVAAVSNVANDGNVTVGHGEGAFRIAAQKVSPNFFPLLGVQPLHGRFPATEEDVAGAADVAVLGYDFWRRNFGADPAVIGSAIALDGAAHEIIGVAPRGFTGVELMRIDAWTPLRSAASSMNSRWESARGWVWLRAIGRLSPDAGRPDVETQATRVHRARHAAEDHYDPDARIVLGPLIAARGVRPSNESRVAAWLGSVSILVLLIACANVANILLAQGTWRQRDVGVRLALGISRRRLMTQLLTESVLLALVGGAAALVIAYSGTVLVRAILLPGVHWAESPLNPRLLGFTFLVASSTGLLAGIVPALHSVRSDVVSILGGGTTRGVARSRSRFRAGMVLLQTTLSVVLLVVAGLFVKSLDGVHSADLGFDARGLVVSIPEFDDDQLPPERRRDFYELASRRLQGLAIVDGVSASSAVPFYSSAWVDLKVPDVPEPPIFTNGGPYVQWITSEYFETLGIKVLRGRGFAAADDQGAPLVAVVEERLAQAYWPDGSALGRCLKIGGADAPCSTIVGVAENTARQSIEQADESQYYAPLAQHERLPSALLIRLGAEPTADQLDLIQREVAAAADGVRFAPARPLAAFMDWQTRSWELGASMFSIFGVLALVIAAVGLYAVMAFNVARRTREIGIRAALGAEPAGLVWLVVRRALLLACVSLGLGLAVSVAGGGWLEPLLFGVAPADLGVLGTVIASQLAVAVLASAIPGMRAARVDAAEALRAD